MPLLAISCVKPAGGVYTLDTDSGAVERVLADDTTGICLTPDGRFLRVLRSEDALEVIDPATWRTNRIVPLPRRNADYHDVQWQDGVVSVVATAHTAVDVLDVTLAPLYGLQFARGRDPWHLNSVVLGDGYALLSVFGQSDTDEGWRADPLAPTGRVLSIGADGIAHVVMNGMCAPHTLRVMPDGRLTVCDSRNSTFIVAERYDDNVVAENFTLDAGFLRGAVRVQNNGLSTRVWYLGLSTNRHGNDGQAKVIEMADDGLVLREWDFPSPEIYDIVEVPCQR